MYCWGRWGDGEMGRLNNEHILYNRILYYSGFHSANAPTGFWL
ncbi:hypothetical protein [Okeania sp. SIO2C9]|nr:hypothetical protein [Okeania sp. SIO2C9]